jgi:tetratricopeptide (TPR) repeat protein
MAFRKDELEQRALGPILVKLLVPLVVLFGLMGANSVYLVAVTLLGEDYQTAFYLYMFLLHLGLGLLLVPLFGFFLAGHMYRAFRHPNRNALKAGLVVFSCCVAILISGVLLLRLEGVVEVRDPTVRSIAYWMHVIAPLVALVFYVIHRLAGPPIKWHWVGAWAGVVALFVVLMASLHYHPLHWGRPGPQEGALYFFPSAIRTATGKFIPAEVLLLDHYCAECHPDAYRTHLASAHRFASFTNKPYLFSVRETRQVSLKREGTVRAARWCAGCHDLVPFLSGNFETPQLEDPNYDPHQDPLGSAGITCISCHAVTAVNSKVGNGALTIAEPPLYPFTFAENRFLKWLNRQLIRAKPALHKKSLLKPFHRPRKPTDPPDAVTQAEFCGACHRVHLPHAVTYYKDWLRGQDHYGTFLGSGFSGHGARSFYYPDKAALGCTECHMPLMASNDFGARDFDGSGTLKIHDHTFVGANTALPAMRGEWETVRKHQEFMRDKLRVDIFGLKRGGTIEGELLAPIRPQIPVLKPGEAYLVEVVLRTLKIGHPFTQGTTDSNEVWLDVTAKLNGRVIGRSGALDEEGYVDPWAHFVNTLILDRHGNRIDRRNPQDIFVRLYDHQVPPGAAQVVHYYLQIPEGAQGTVELHVKLNYRKFDRIYMDYVFGKGKGPTLPISFICEDKVIFPVGSETKVPEQAPPAEAWTRWNDYGIGLFLEGESMDKQGELRQALEAFQKVAELGSPHGYVNQARVYIKEGNLPAAIDALHRAAESDPPFPYPWVITWLTGLVNKQNGFLEEAIANFREIVSDALAEKLRDRHFDFRKDAVVWIELGSTQFELAKRYRVQGDLERYRQLLHEAADSLERALEVEPETVVAQAHFKGPVHHFNLHLIYQHLSGTMARGVKTAASSEEKAWLSAAQIRELLQQVTSPETPDPLREEVALRLARAIEAYVAPDAAREKFEGRPDLLQEVLQQVRPVYRARREREDSTTQALAWLLATLHRSLHSLYLPDPDAMDRAVAIYRGKNPAANHAAEAIVIYPLHRPGAPGLAHSSSPVSGSRPEAAQLAP